MIKAVLIDDEILCLETLDIELREYCPDVEVVAKCSSAEDGISAIRSVQPDLVFLDIELPTMNAFELLQTFDEITFDIIFVTAYDTYAIKAFDVNALDYLLKPIQKNKLLQAIDKVEQKQERGIKSKDLNKFKESLRTPASTKNNIALPTLEGFEFVKIDLMIYAKADSNYTTIFLANGKKVTLSKTLKEVESLLDGFPFIRIHQSFLVNIDHMIKYVKGSGGYVIMSNGEAINVSRSHKTHLLNLFKGN